MPIEDKLRRASLNQLQAFFVFIKSPETVVTTSDISDSTSTADQSLGGIISGLSRFKTKEGSLIIPAGRLRDRRLRWRLNEKVITKEKLSELLDEIFGEEAKKYKVEKKPSTN